MQNSDVLEMFPHFFLDRFRKHRRAVSPSFAIVDRDQVPPEIEILHPQPQAFHLAHPASIHQPREQFGPPCHRVEEPCHLVHRQHDWHSPFPGRPFIPAEVAHIEVEHFVVEKRDGIERLVLCGNRDVPVRRQVRFLMRLRSGGFNRQHKSLVTNSLRA